MHTILYYTRDQWQPECWTKHMYNKANLSHSPGITLNGAQGQGEGQISTQFLCGAHEPLKIALWKQRGTSALPSLHLQSEEFTVCIIDSPPHWVHRITDTQLLTLFPCYILQGLHKMDVFPAVWMWGPESRTNKGRFKQLQAAHFKGSSSNSLKFIL